MATAVMNAPFLAPRPSDWQFPHHHPQQQHHLSMSSEAAKERQSQTAALKQLQRSGPAASARRERPCDGCRRRKSKCVLQDSRRCVLCDFHKQECTFVEEARPRKRKAVDSSGPAEQQQQQLRRQSQQQLPQHNPQQHQNQQQYQQHQQDQHQHQLQHQTKYQTSKESSDAPGHQLPPKPLDNNGRNDSLAASSPRRRLSSSSQPHAANSAITALSSPVSAPSAPSALSAPHTPFALDRSLSLQPHRHCRYIGRTTALDPTLIGLSIFSSRHETDSTRLGKIRRVTGGEFFSTHDDADVPIPADDARALAAISSLVGGNGAALISIYFRNVHPSYPIIQKRVFRDRHRHRFSPPLLAAIYLLALPWWYSDPVLACLPAPDEARLEQVAMQSLTISMESPKMSAVQAGLLLLQRGGPLASWKLTVQLVALGQEIGLHLDCSRWAIPPWERKLRKRVAWALYVQDKWSALVHGRPSHVNPSDWAVPPLTEADFDEGTSFVDDSHVDIEPSTFRSSSNPPLPPSLSTDDGTDLGFDMISNPGDDFDNNCNDNCSVPKIVEEYEAGEMEKEQEEHDADQLVRGRLLFTNLISLTSIMAEISTAFYSQAALAEFRRVGWPRATQLVLLRAKPVQIRLKEWFARLPPECKVDVGLTASSYSSSSSSSPSAAVTRSWELESKRKGGSDGVEVAAGALQLAYFATEISIHRRIMQSLVPAPDEDFEITGRETASERVRLVPAPSLPAISVDGGNISNNDMTPNLPTSSGPPSSPSITTPAPHPTSPSTQNHDQQPASRVTQCHIPSQPPPQPRQHALPHPDPNLLSICRSAAKHRLISAMDFTNRLTPAHLSSFWYFGSAANLALIGSFGALLQATSPGAEEAAFYAARLREFRWTLAVSAPRADWVLDAVDLVDGVVDLLAHLAEKPSFAGPDGAGSRVQLTGFRADKVGSRQQGDGNGSAASASGLIPVKEDVLRSDRSSDPEPGVSGPGAGVGVVSEQRHYDLESLHLHQHQQVQTRQIHRQIGSPLEMNDEDEVYA